MATLEGIDLGTGLYIEKQAGLPRVQAVMERSRNDDILIWQQAAGPQAFDLVGTANTGAWKKTVLDQVIALSEMQISTFELVYDNRTIEVVFRHWEGDVIEASGLVPRERMTDNDYYNNVRIKLHEIEV